MKSEMLALPMANGYHLNMLFTVIYTLGRPEIIANGLRTLLPYATQHWDMSTKKQKEKHVQATLRATAG